MSEINFPTKKIQKTGILVKAEKITCLTKNKLTESAATILRHVAYKLQFHGDFSHFCSKEIKTVKNNL